MNTALTFPLVVTLAPRFVAHLDGCEQPSFEDYQNGEPQRIEGSPHICEILARRKSGIEIRSAAEVNEVYYSLASGTFQLRVTDWSGMPGALKEARRICDYLRPHVTDDVARQFYPDGH